LRRLVARLVRAEHLPCAEAKAANAYRQEDGRYGGSLPGHTNAPGALTSR
jgi:hypothetical protein